MVHVLASEAEHKRVSQTYLASSANLLLYFSLPQWFGTFVHSIQGDSVCCLAPAQAPTALATSSIGPTQLQRSSVTSLQAQSHMKTLYMDDHMSTVHRSIFHQNAKCSPRPGRTLPEPSTQIDFSTIQPWKTPSPKVKT
eukprot:4358611-Amphidinium_carterae.1